MKRIDLSVIIVSYNAADLLQKCLQGVYEHTSQCNFEVIVVDNASAENNAQLVREHFPDVILIENMENTGYARAINQGIEKAEGEFCAIMNGDTELTANVFSPALEYCNANSDAGLVGCTLLSPDGKPQRSFFKFPSLLGRLSYFTGINRIINAGFLKNKQIARNNADVLSTVTAQNRSNSSPVASIREVEVVCGAFFIVRREALRSVGGFDPDYFLYHEEADVCYRLHKSGFRNVVLTGQSIIHHGKHYETAETPLVYYHRNRSLLLYFYKNRSRFSLWILIKMNTNFLLLKILYSLLPFGQTTHRKQRRTAHFSVLQYHLKFVIFLLNKHVSKFPE